MANVKISQLPSWTGSVPDLRWFVMNNSGETTTYKFSGYTAQAIPGNGSNSIVSQYLPRTYAPDQYMIVMGNFNAASSGDYSIAIGGRNNKTTNQFGGVFAGNNNSAGYICAIVGGNSNTANGNASGIFAGENNTVTNGFTAAILGGYNNNTNGSNESGNGILGGYSCSVTSNGSRSQCIIGGNSNNIRHDGSGGSTDVGRGLNVILGGESNIIGGTSNQDGKSANCLIASSKSSKIDSRSSGIEIHQSSIIGSESSILTGTTGSTLISCLSSSANTKTRVVMLGTSGRTGSLDYTTYQENQHLFRTQSVEVQPVLSGVTFTGTSAINLNLGGKPQLYLTGTSSIEFTNVRDGQSFILKTQTDGNYTVTWTSTGYTFKFAGAVSSPGNTTIDLWRFEVYGSVIYGQRIHDFS